MPYITTEARQEIDSGQREPENMGELTYVLSRAVDRYVHSKGLSFQTAGEANYALLASAQEFYRRVLRPYEDQKLLRNGEVFFSQLNTCAPPPETPVLGRRQ